MAKITLYTRNILETGTVTVTGTPDTGFPESRLYDRSISLFWKDTVTEAKTFVVDQSASDNLAVDFLAIEKHNFSGADIQWQWSTDNFSASINDAVTDWTQTDNTQITKTLTTALTKRYWRTTLSSMANPKCGEIFMSYGYEFKVRFDNPPKLMSEANTKWSQTVGGIERSTKFGDKRKVRNYSIFLSTSAELDNFRAAIDDLDDYSKPFYIKDHEGDYWICRFQDVPQEEPVTDENTVTVINVSFIEML